MERKQQKVAPILIKRVWEYRSSTSKGFPLVFLRIRISLRFLSSNIGNFCFKWTRFKSAHKFSRFLFLAFATEWRELILSSSAMVQWTVGFFSSANCPSGKFEYWNIWSLATGDWIFSSSFSLFKVQHLSSRWRNLSLNIRSPDFL